jgi:hypothetical protein
MRIWAALYKKSVNAKCGDLKSVVSCNRVSQLCEHAQQLNTTWQKQNTFPSSGRKVRKHLLTLPVTYGMAPNKDSICAWRSQFPTLLPKDKNKFSFRNIATSFYILNSGRSKTSRLWTVPHTTDVPPSETYKTYVNQVQAFVALWDPFKIFIPTTPVSNSKILYSFLVFSRCTAHPTHISQLHSYNRSNGLTAQLYFVQNCRKPKKNLQIPPTVLNPEQNLL